VLRNSAQIAIMASIPFIVGHLQSIKVRSAVLSELLEASRPVDASATNFMSD